VASTTVVSTLNGNYKRVYGKISQAVPEVDWCLENIKWDQGNIVGDSYEELVVVRSENGYTYGGSGGTAYTLNASVAMQTEPARVTPFEYTMTSRVAYGAAKRAAKAGPRAFAKWSVLLMKNMMESVARRLEISVIHGQHAQGIAQIAIGKFTNASTICTIIVSEDQWAAGIWQGSEGALAEVYSSGDTKIVDGSNTTIEIFSVDFRTRTIQAIASSATLAGNVTTSNATAVVNIFFVGSRTNDMVGMKQIFSNTGGTIHGISAGTYGAWAGNLFTAGNEPMTMAKVFGFAAQIQARSRKNKERVFLCSPFTWTDLHQEQMAARSYDESYSKDKIETGSEEIVYFSPSGKIRVVAHPCMKGGEALLFPLSTMKRIGSAEKEWEIPGADSDPWAPVAGVNAAEIRNYSDQTVFCSLPAECAYVDDIINTYGTTGQI